MTDNRTLEDTLQCYFFTPSPISDIKVWEQLCENINNTIKTLTVDYIWHRDELKVYLPFDMSTKDDVPPHLISLSCFGDNIEDEWFMVYLILEITKQYKDLIVQVKDNDGDFLLIEAADCLPPWANPDNTENRVFIHNGHIHLIPLTVADKKTDLSLIASVQFVSEPTISTEAPEIEKVILKRIGDYPEKNMDNFHRVTVKLPLDIATLLTLDPSLVSPLVTTYSNHDVIDAMVCKNIKFENCVIVKVTFTKFLYAMLIHSKYIKNNKYAILNENEKKCALGIKLTSGYEIIMSKLTQNIFASKAYNKFLKSLTDNGYFRENIEGSKGYKQLLEKAKDFFLDMECPINSQVGNKISQLIHSKEFVELRHSLKNRPAPESELIDDNEDWLTIHPEQLNELLNIRYGKQLKFKDNDVITAQTITSQLSNFLKQTSDFEGIEPREGEEEEDTNIEFDSDDFIKSLKNMLNMISDNGSMNDSNSDGSGSSDGEENVQEENELDKELKYKLHTDDNEKTESSKTVMYNIMRSMKEEGSSGPSSNILRTVGINKTDLLDSDDDEI